MKTLRIPDHVANGRSSGITQKHRVLGLMAEGGCNLGIEPGRDVVDDICAVIFIQYALVISRLVPGTPTQQRCMRRAICQGHTSCPVGVDVLRVPVLSIGTVGDHKFRPDSLDIFSDRLGELCQRYIYRTGGTIDFHIGINIGQKKDIPSTKSTCCFAGLLFSIGAQVLRCCQRRLADFPALTPGRLQDVYVGSLFSEHCQGPTGKQRLIVGMRRHR